MKKLISLVLALAMVATLGLAFAADYGTANQAHTITVTSNGTGAHSYEAYQVFVGNLDAAENKLTDIKWGSGVNGDSLLEALQQNATTKTAMADAKTAADVAEILGKNTTAAFVEAFASVVADNLSTTVAGTGTSSGGADNKATINVSGDGYYFVKDVTNELADGDTYSKFMLNVVKDTAVVAKDTAFQPDKSILVAQGEDFTRVAADSAAIGDTVTFEVVIDIPDTTAYVDHFIMNMIDTLPTGMTLMEVTSVKANGTDVPAANYTVTAKTGTGEYGTYTKPATTEAAVAAAGGQTLKVVFNNFKAYVETNSLIGKKLVVTYTAVVNDDAVFGPTGNENEVKYIYSNNPNHDYDGDEPGSNDPTGETPHDKTKTVVTQLKILKVDGANDNPLAGAEFTVTGEAFNYVIKTGERFVVDANGTYWLLKDGSYTTQDPNTEGMNQTQYADVNTKYSKEEYTEVQSTPSDYKQVGITNSEGIFQLSGLKPGTYTIEETHAPDGYNKIVETKQIEITWTLADGFGLTKASEDAGFAMKDNGVIYEITIENNQGTTLPSTGGIGTTIFYILGGLLVIGAAVILVARRKAQD